MNVAILAVGNEVLCGKTLNTNALYLAKEIESLGAVITHQQVVSDNVLEIVFGLKVAFEKADFIFTIGGLGPTVDDVTKEGVANFFNMNLVYDEHIYKSIQNHFSRTNKQMSSNNIRQAYRFESCEVLQNENGTAPGLIVSTNNQTVVLLPGPPKELQLMFQTYLTSFIASKLDEEVIRRSYRLVGIGESAAEEKIIELYDLYPMLSIAPYCTISHVDYVVTTKKSNELVLDNFELAFKANLQKYLIGDTKKTLSEVIVSLLKSKCLTIATAESCSGGLLASSIVDVFGCSSVFLEGVVTYSYDSKVRLLNIDRERLNTYGAVSEEIAYDMAVNLRALSGCDIAMSVTGIAGPTGGSKEKPVGLVYIGINVCGKVLIQSYIFNGNREKIREQTVSTAQYLLYKTIKAL